MVLQNPVFVTVPKAVTNLIAEFVNTTAIKLTWLRQSDHKPSYSYEVIALLGAMMVKNGSTENETYTFSMLSPGTLYTFKVFTVVEEVKSTVESTENYTSMSSEMCFYIDAFSLAKKIIIPNGNCNQ